MQKKEKLFMGRVKDVGPCKGRVSRGVMRPDGEGFAAR